MLQVWYLILYKRDGSKTRYASEFSSHEKAKVAAQRQASYGVCASIHFGDSRYRTA